MATDLIRDLVARLTADDVHLYVDGAELKYRARKGAIQEADRKQVRERKSAIMDYLRKLQAIEAEHAAALPPIERAERESGGLALSYGQQRLWFIDQLGEGSLQYNMPVAHMLEGELEIGAFERALGSLMERHEVLRTRFVEERDEPRQVIATQYTLPLQLHDLSAMSEQELAREARRLMRQEERTPFDLSRDLMLRVRLLKLSSKQHLVLYTLHHIASDGWSLGIFFRELMALYQAYAAGEPSPLAPLPIQYADYAQWQRRWLRGEALESQLSYWREQLKDLPPLLTLTTDRPRPVEQTFCGSTERLPLTAELSQELQALSREQGVTLYMTLLSAFAVLLGRYSGQQDVAVGTPIANRTRKETEGLIGFFVNTLVMRLDLGGDPRFVDLLKRTREMALQAYAHQELPFEKLVEHLNPERSLSHTPLFQVMFNLTSAPIEGLSLPGLAVQPLDSGTVEENEGAREGISRFDLMLSVQETPAGLVSGFEYNTDLFDSKTIRRMLSHYVRLLEAIVAAPLSRLSHLEMLDAVELRQQLEEWNATACPYPRDSFIHELFEAQARLSPDRIALVFEAHALTYAELDARANQLAHYLIGRGVGPGTCVALCMERSLEMVIGLLGVLKAGGAYVPLEPTYPLRRLAYMVADSAPKVILTHDQVDRSVREHLNSLVSNATVLDLRADAERWAAQGRERPKSQWPALSPAHVAYVIYTSGSTGQPKGVMVAHRGLVNRLWWMQQAYGLGECDSVLQKTPFSFDVSVWEFFWPLMVGAKLVMAQPEGHKDRDYLIQAVRAHGISVLHFVPSMLQAFLDDGGVGRCSTLKRVICSGEALSGPLARRFKKWLPYVDLQNLYGPTEATVDVTAWCCSDTIEDSIPIGRPIANTQMYVLDENLRPLPAGVPGELFIGGAGLAVGYLNRRGLTAERFLPSVHPLAPGDRIYRTGDLARWRTDGSLEYLGRIDNQVKVRGHRIELGEIESALRGHEAVRDVVVVVRESPEGQQLVGYVVAEVGAQTDPVALIRELRSRLQEQLPGFMVPSAVILLSRLPLTPNGKLDRKALPAPEAPLSGAELMPPQGPTEELLAELWCVVLKRERVGRHDHFFELGGHSLLATQLASRIRETFSTALAVRELFEHPTLSSQARAVELARGAGAPAELAMEAVSRDEPLPLSYAQQRLWFLHEYLGANAVYNIPLALRLRGDVNEAALLQSLQELYRRHESLRTRFENRDGGPVQLLGPPELELRVEAVSATESRAIAHWERAHHFDLSRERLCRIRLLRETGGGPGDYLLLVTMHHSVSDGWSLGIFFREFMILYQAFTNGERSPLAPLPIQYADYAQWQRRWLQGEVLERQLSYWREQLKDLPPLLSMPTDRPRPVEQTFRGSTERLELPLVLSERLQALNRAHGVTMFMTLLSGWSVLLGRYAGQKDLAIGTPIANRTRRETEGLIGFFVNTLVMRQDLSGDPSFEALLKRTRETALQAYAHQDVPFEQLVEALNPERSVSHSPLFQVMFILQNMPVESVELPGLAVQGLATEATDDGESRSEGTARFDLTLSVQESAAGLMGILEYNTDLFDRDTVRRLLAHYRRLLEAIVAAPAARLSQLPMLDEMERQQQIIEWNATARSYPHDKCIHELFEAQAQRRPDAVALVHEDRVMTCGELNRRANQLAHELARRGVGPESRVGLCLPRSIEMVVGLLGILKAGGAYVPLDPDYPRKRLDYLLEDAGIDLVVTEPGVASSVAGPGRELLWLTAEPVAASAHVMPDGESRSRGLRPEHPAYLIYTSASTGSPKGVVGLHQSIVNRVSWLAGSLGVGADEVLCQKTSLGFVDHVAEIFQALSAGVPLVIISPAVLLAPQRLLGELDCRRVTQLTLVPSLLKTVLEAGRGARARSLKSIYCSGEALHLSGLDQLAECFPQARLFNIYGSTEMGADVTCQEVSAASLHVGGQWAPIGKGIDNTQAYILDSHGQLAAAGAVGELQVGGVCLARGYYQRVALTAEKFMPHPFSSRRGERLFCTGDLARWRPDGTLEYLGRVDSQVKVRGFRIELGEIEGVLRAHAGVRDAVVLAREDKGETRLVGYIVAKSGAQADAAALIRELRGHLLEQLPGYMVPQAVSWLETLPLTPAGKVDRKALPALDESGCESQYAPPEGSTEETLAKLWCLLLKRERVGRHDNFFELGGHSMLAVRLVGAIRQEFAAELPLQVIFESPTIASLGRRLGSARAEAASPDGVEWVSGSL